MLRGWTRLAPYQSQGAGFSLRASAIALVCAAARTQPLPAVPNAISVSLGLDEVLGFATELKLSVTNSGRQAVVACNRGAALHWKDQLSGGVIAACGNLNFSAVALQSGNLCVSPRPV